MVDKSELLRVPAFADLPDDQIAWFLSQSEELHLKAGETLLPGKAIPRTQCSSSSRDSFRRRGEFGGETVVSSP